MSLSGEQPTFDDLDGPSDGQRRDLAVLVGLDVERRLAVRSGVDLNLSRAARRPNEPDVVVGEMGDSEPVYPYTSDARSHGSQDGVDRSFRA